MTNISVWITAKLDVGCITFTKQDTGFDTQDLLVLPEGHLEMLTAIVSEHLTRFDTSIAVRGQSGANLKKG